MIKCIHKCGCSSVVEHNLAKVGVEGSNPFARSKVFVFFCVGVFMAKGPVIAIKLLSSAGTGYFYVTKKNPRTMTEKLELKKYDPKIRKHVMFKEYKIK